MCVGGKGEFGALIQKVTKREGGAFHRCMRFIGAKDSLFQEGGDRKSFRPLSFLFSTVRGGESVDAFKFG